MPLLLNVESGRELREGDEVRVLSGVRRGEYGKVVGFDMHGVAPVVVQYPAPRSGVIREEFGANDVQLSRAMSAPESLEPLPEVSKLLQDNKIRRNFKTCGAMFCIQLDENGTNLTFVPKKPGVVLGDVFKAKLAEGTFEEAVEGIFDESFVTRLPHLVEFSLSKDIDALLEAGASDEAVAYLLEKA